VSSFEPTTIAFPLPSPPPPHCQPSRARSPTRITAIRRIAVYRSQIDVWHFLVDNRPELWSETATHARLVAVALLIAVPPAVALGVAAAGRPRLASLALGTAGVIFTIPSLALFALLVGPLGLGTGPAVAALALYSVLPVLRNTVVGLDEVPAEAIEAARGMGMTETQALWRVRLPLALPVVLGGVRVAAVTAVGIATVAALVAAGGLGDSIFAGLRAGDDTQVLAATAVIAALALAVDATLALVERGLRR
jgi:ABC-type proline/glycine betaine transport system permease subunit